MSAYRIPTDDPREGDRREGDRREPARAERRDDMLGLVRQRLSQSPRVVRLSGRTRRAVADIEPAPSASDGGR